MKFNEIVHVSNEHGDPVRNEDGNLRLKTNWKDVAVDRKGRKYNARVHGAAPTLDDDGFLKVARRDEPRKPMVATRKLTDFVEKHREKGYTYRVVNDEGGRIQTFQKHDWEPVMAEDGVARIPVGQARSPGTQAVLMRKPEEWYEEDQRVKDELLNAHLEKTTAPQEGQYDPTGPDGKSQTKLR